MSNRGIVLCFLLLSTVGVVEMNSQSCISFTSDYAMYANISTDDTNIYTSVLVDGYGSMTVNQSLPGCATINPSNAVHTPIAINVVAHSDGTSPVGGPLYGTPECPTCYLNVMNNQSVPIVAELQYNFSESGAVMCSVGGSVGAAVATCSLVFQPPFGGLPQFCCPTMIADGQT